MAWRYRALVVLLLAIASSPPASAQSPIGYPRTQYKPADIERARANIARHQWAQAQREALQRSVERYQGLTREDIRAYISDLTPLVTVACPQCGNGPWYAYDVLDRATKLRCKACGAEFTWDPKDRSQEWNIQAAIRYFRLDWITSGCSSLGLLYQLDGDEQCARQAGWIAERMAEVFKGYRMNRVNANTWMDRNDPYYGRICGWKFREMGVLKEVILGYDLVRDSGLLTHEQIATIDRDLIAHVRDYILEAFADIGLLGTQSIQDQGYTWWCLSACAAMLGDTQTLEMMADTWRTMLGPDSSVFYEDGTFFQGTWAYQSQFLSGAWPIPEVLRGNLDVDIYADPQCALYEKALTWYLDAIFPDGTMPAINDAHVGSRPALQWSEIAWLRYGNQKALRHLVEAWGEDLGQGTIYSLFYRDPDAGAADGRGEEFGTQSTHLTGAGQMILRDDRPGEQRTMAFIDYGPYLPAPHKQRDYLNLGLFACGMEMISEIGYAHQPAWAQAFQVSPLAHNTVLEVAGQEGMGEPLIWQITPGPRLAEAGLPPGNSRFIALLPVPGAEPILVDIFRVSGDAPSFTWAMHARSGDLAIEGVETAPAEVAEPLRNGRQGVAAGDLSVTWRFEGETPRGLRVILPGADGATVTISECPPEEDVILATHVGGGALKPGAVIPYRGHLQLTRPGPEAVFVAVHVPWQGEAMSQVTVRRSAIEGRPQAVALEIDCGGTRFVVLHDPEAGECRFGDLVLDGRAAVATLQGAALQSLCLASGASARWEDARVEADAVGNGFRQVAP
ncbi:MAG: hypothetical protein AB7Y46_05795 [Armatimonadota bacterium]